VAVNDDVRRRLRVNPVLCQGYGYCAEIVPEIVSLDDWGFPAVNPGLIDDGKVLHLAERAIATCPRLALVLEQVVSDHD
jgi:ferredoxin